MKNNPQMDFRQHLFQLDSLLAGHTWLWRPQPFKQARPDWCQRLPELCRQLLSLNEEELQGLTDNTSALNALLAEHLPELAPLALLTRIPELPEYPLKELGPHFHSGIPGRKWQQITAFTATLNKANAPVLEWCGGKGHLGRLISTQWQQPVLTLEYNATLCEEGKRLAERVHAEQSFYLGDAFSPGSDNAIKGRHPIALHACGGLHRNLVQRAVTARVPALDFAPCCYHLYSDEQYSPLTPGTQLRLSSEDMRLAVTETVTAVGREIRLRDQEMAWKLGFDQLRQSAISDTGYRPIKPIDKSWLNRDFADFCEALAQREGIALPSGTDWNKAEQVGWLRQHETMRLSLVRHAFRRAIELWLVLDLVNYLAANGYHVTVGTFCNRSLTPRNILVSARNSPWQHMTDYNRSKSQDKIPSSQDSVEKKDESQRN